MNIAFIGLGSMGQPIAANLLRAGHRLRVWNRSADKAQTLVSEGAQLASSAAEACTDVDAVFTMLADDTALRAVLDGGATDALRRPTVLVNLSTISVAYARELSTAMQARGIGYVAAPVFGRPPAAAAAQLNILVAGDEESVRRVEPALSCLAKKLWPMGAAPERANVVKIAGNFMLASAIESMAEASAFARAHGIEAADFLEVMTQTLFAAPAYTGYAKLIADRQYQPAGFTMQLGLKDVELALTAAGHARVPLPIASVIRDALLDALAHGGADHDWAMLAEVAARRAGLPAE